MPNRKQDQPSPRVMFMASERRAYHFGDAPAILESLGVGVAMETLQPHVPLTLTDTMAQNASLIVHTESVSGNARGVRMAASRNGATLALLMDGVVEYANTFINPTVGPAFLRPAPGEAVLCAGRHDRALLRALGNFAVSCGLPRLDLFARDCRGVRCDLDPQGVLIATANCPSFTFSGRTRVLETFDAIRVALRRRGIPARWRIADGLADELGVPKDELPLAESLASVRAVLTTASTLAFEAMLAGKPTAVLHPHPWPLWLPCAWVHRGVAFHGFEDDLERVHSLRGVADAANAAATRSLNAIQGGITPVTTVSAGELIDGVLAPPSLLMELQRRSLAGAIRANACRRVAKACERLVTRKSSSARIRVAAVQPSRGEAASPKPPGVVRVVSLVNSHNSSVGGVAAWSERMERYFASEATRGETRVDWHTILIGPDEPATIERLAERPNAHACVIDPTAVIPLQSEPVSRLLRELSPDIVLPNYSDLSYYAALRERDRSGRACRVIAAAHTNDSYYRSLIASHDWDGAVAVSDACAEWLRPLAGDRPYRKVVYGVPSAPFARLMPDTTLRLAYVGRMVEAQKRVSDLLVLIAAMDELGVSYEFDIVGDGDALSLWQRRLVARKPRGEVRIHGARSLDWVQRFWPKVDVNVLVSDSEGTSISMLESMAHGVIPCVTAVDTGVTDIVQDGVNGIAVPVGDMSRMAARLGAIGSDLQARSAIAAAARRTICEKGLTVESCAVAWRGLFTEVLARPGERHTLEGKGAPIVPSAGPNVASQRSRWYEEWESGIRSTFERLVESGHRRIAGFAGAAVRRWSVEWLTRQPEHFCGFVHPRVANRATMFGAPCMNTREALEGAVDAVILFGSYPDLEGYVATYDMRRRGVTVEPPITDPLLANGLDAICEQAKQYLDRKARIASTCRRTLFIEANRILSVALAVQVEERPDFLVLKGDEIDFADYAASKPWRDLGTTVCSLRFSESELSSPERYSEIVEALDSHQTFAIYGAGRHTERLLELAMTRRRPEYIIDDRANGPRALGTIPIISPAFAEQQPPHTVILSSTRFENEMWERTAPWRQRGIRVVRFYAPNQVLAV